MTIEPQRECPRWDKCSVNFCPLDPFQNQRPTHEADIEQKCTIAKTIRQRIGTKYPNLLPRFGLTSKEWAARLRFANMSWEQRQAMVERGKKSLNKFNHDKKYKQ